MPACASPDVSQSRLSKSLGSNPEEHSVASANDDCCSLAVGSSLNPTVLVVGDVKGRDAIVGTD